MLSQDAIGRAGDGHNGAIDVIMSGEKAGPGVSLDDAISHDGVMVNAVIIERAEDEEGILVWSMI